MPDLHEFGPARDAEPAVYAPLDQWPSRSLDVVLRTAGDTGTEQGTGALLAGARDALRRVDGDVALHDAATLEAVLSASAEQFLTLGKLLSTLAAMAVLLAVVGVHASMACAVARRVPEIGVRMALGADAASVRCMILSGGRRGVSGADLVVGLLLALVAAQGLSAFLFGVDSADTATLSGAATLILAVSLAAVWLPARRASAVDPAVALRGE